MDSGSQMNSGSQGNPRLQSFLESLRNRQVSPGEANPIMGGAEVFGEKRRVEEARRQEFFKTRSREFNEVYSLTKKKEENRIEEIHAQLKKLAKSVKRLDQNIAKTVSEDTVKPGVYHQNIFEYLISMITLIQTQTNCANSWLEAYNARSKKKSYYWSLASQKGTKFTQALDRNVATSVG